MKLEEQPSLPTDPVVEAYKKDVECTLFDRTLALSPEDRVRQLQAFVRLQFELQRAARTNSGVARDCPPHGLRGAAPVEIRI